MCFRGEYLQVGSWTKSRDKLQFLVNKEMESKVGKNNLSEC